MSTRSFIAGIKLLVCSVLGIMMSTSVLSQNHLGRTFEYVADYYSQEWAHSQGYVIDTTLAQTILVTNSISKFSDTVEFYFNYPIPEDPDPFFDQTCDSIVIKLCCPECVEDRFNEIKQVKWWNWKEISKDEFISKKGNEVTISTGIPKIFGKPYLTIDRNFNKGVYARICLSMLRMSKSEWKEYLK